MPMEVRYKPVSKYFPLLTMVLTGIEPVSTL